MVVEGGDAELVEKGILPQYQVALGGLDLEHGPRALRHVIASKYKHARVHRLPRLVDGLVGGQENVGGRHGIDRVDQHLLACGHSELRLALEVGDCDHRGREAP